MNTIRSGSRHGSRVAVIPTLTTLALLLAGITTAEALSVFGATATFAGGSITGWSVSVSGNGIAAGDTVTLQYQTSTGTAIGAPVTTTVGPGGVITVPPPPIPAGAAGLGNQVVITFVDAAGLTHTSVPLIWYNAAWFWGTTPAIKVDPLGLPGLTSPQSWFIDEIGLELGGSSLFGTFTSALTESNFDLAYLDLGGGLFDASIIGDNSFIRLANDTYIGFADGSHFGTLQYLFFDDLTANGLFDFTAIGLAGVWQWSAASNYTRGVGTGTSFEAPAISVPEPSALMLFAASASLLVWRKRMRARST
jgi:hypothetical protein